MSRPTSTINSTTTAANTAANTSSTSASKAPPPPLTIAPGALVADKASITGTHRITIARNATIHPFARLDSSAAAIEIGEAAAVWEKAVVGAPSPVTKDPGGAAGPTTATTSIGSFASIAPHASVGAGAVVGAHSSVEVGARVAPGCVVGAHCRLAAMTSVPDEEGGEEVAREDFTVVYFAEDGVQKRRVNVSARDSARVRELEARAREKERDILGRVMHGAAATGKWT